MNEDKREENELDKYISEMKEWQDNQFNPGYYIGTGRTPRPIRSLSRYPLILIIFGVLGVFISLISFVTSKFIISNLPSLMIGLLISICFIYGGVVRHKSKRSQKHK
jgi:hypothetical protein